MYPRASLSSVPNDEYSWGMQITSLVGTFGLGGGSISLAPQFKQRTGSGTYPVTVIAASVGGAGSPTKYNLRFSEANALFNQKSHDLRFPRANALFNQKSHDLKSPPCK